MKRKKSQTLLYSLCLLLVSAILPLTGAAAPTSTPTEPIKIGAILMLTGPAASAGIACEQGIRLKLDEVGWEVAGRKIELMVEDSGGKPDVSMEKARKLVESDKVDVIITPIESKGWLATAAYFTRKNIPGLGLGEWSSGFEKYANGSLFLHGGATIKVTYPLGLYVYDKLGYRTAIVVHKDDVGGRDYVQGFIDAFKEKGGTIVNIMPVPSGTQDYYPYLGKMKKVDIVPVALYPGDVPRFAKQYRESGLKMPLAAVPFYYTSEAVLKEIGDMSIGMLGVGGNGLELDTPASKQYFKAFQSKYGAPPAFEATWAYITTTMCVAALKERGNDTTGEKLIQVLAKIEVDTIAGRLSYPPERIGRMGQDSWVAKVVKTGDRYHWRAIETIPASKR